MERGRAARTWSASRRWWRTARSRLAAGLRLRDRLLTEAARSYVAGGVATVLSLAPVMSSADGRQWGVVDHLLVFLAGYQLVYVVLTLAVYLPASPRTVARAAVAMPRRGLVHRWLLVAEPGAGAALVVGAGAMAAAVVVLPQADRFSSVLSAPLLVAICVALIVSAWATMVLTYAVDYLRRDAATGGLRFPGEGPRVFSDYLYVAVSVGTTFGTTDVEVTSSALRRTVTGQALAAFLFNAVIVAMTVASIAALAA
ncbi:DUF1345 domain-containing protein [Cellulomonas xiejunii]|uniref:DUF1345 domain-containing protein n=1 Tax=Cellulomonas xiejunii TaxID=2968083 RepID=A0ABY5KTS4_9CELL|nr:DUF1345 domain-containing protein [Cellulomonas xiejunii]UUI71738.1 DUF1345 domain-containing protein [Cellulomonas xiejunii]